MRNHHLALALSLAAMTLFFSACAHHERRVVRLQSGTSVDLTHLDLHRQSLIIELHEGEVVPLDVTVEGDYFATAPGTSVPVTVKRTCFLRVDDRGVRISSDGQNFDDKARIPGSFRFGIGMTPEGKRGTLHVVMPAR